MPRRSRRPARRAEGLAHEAVGAAVDGLVLEGVRPAHRQDAHVGTDAGASDEGEAAVDLGEPWVDDHDVGPLLDGQRQRRATVPGTPDDGGPWPPMASSPARLSRTRSSASTTSTRSGPVSGPDSRACRMVGPDIRHTSNGPYAAAIARGRTTRPATSSVADRATGLGTRRERHARAAPPVLERGLRPMHLDRGAAAGLRCTRRRRRCFRLGPASRPARGGRPGRSPGRSPCRRPRPAGGRRPACRDLDPDLLAAGVLDDVVERLLGDPVQRLLDRRSAAARSGRSRPRPAARSDPAARRVGLEGADQAVLLEVAGAQLEDQRAHLGQGLALEVAELRQLLARAVRVRSRSISMERDTSVIENSAWVTESCSSRARWARSSPAASSPAWRRSSPSRRTCSLTSRAAPWVPANRPSTTPRSRARRPACAGHRARAGRAGASTRRRIGLLTRDPAVGGERQRGLVDDDRRSAGRSAPRRSSRSSARWRPR